MAFFSRHFGTAGLVILTHLLLFATPNPLPFPDSKAFQGTPTTIFNASDTLLTPANAPLVPVPSTDPPLLLELIGTRAFAPSDPTAVTTALDEAIANYTTYPPTTVFPVAEQRFPAVPTTIGFSMGNFLMDETFTYGQAVQCVRTLEEALEREGNWKRGGARVRRADGGGRDVVTYMQLGSPHAGGVVATA